MTLFIVSIAIAFGVSFLCSIMEAALLSITPSQIAVISERSPAKGKICRDFKKDIEKPIAVILILNTAAHTFGASIAGAEFDELFGNSYIWLFSLIFTILMVQYTEILPKTLGVRFNARVISWTAQTLKYLVRIMTPLITLVHLINRPFDPKRDAGKDDKVNIGEITALASMARKAEQITTTQEQIIRNTPMLGKRSIEELMLPLEKVCIIPAEASRAEVLSQMRNDQHSRYPVIDNQGQIIGCLYAKDLLFHKEEEWKELMRPVKFIDTRLSQLELIENVVKLDSKLLMVRDENQKIIGMLTVNDALLELVGQEFPEASAPSGGSAASSSSPAASSSSLPLPEEQKA